MSESNGEMNDGSPINDLVDNCVNDIRDIIDNCVNDLLKIAKSMYHPHSRGVLSESQFRKMCEDRNLTVTKDLLGKHDMEVNGHRVQCKQTDVIICSKTRIKIGTMRSIKANGSQYGYKTTEHDVVALSSKKRIYLIPVDQITNPKRPGFVKDTILLEDYKHCINAWSVFDGEKPLPQGRLFT